jgi:hypothetical protein
MVCIVLQCILVPQHDWHVHVLRVAATATTRQLLLLLLLLLLGCRYKRVNNEFTGTLTGKA